MEGCGRAPRNERPDARPRGPPTEAGGGAPSILAVPGAARQARGSGLLFGLAVDGIGDALQDLGGALGIRKDEQPLLFPTGGLPLDHEQ